MLSTIMVRLMIIMTVQFNFSILRINGSIWCREYVLYRCVSKGWISRDVIASTIPGISMNPIIEIAQDTLF